MRFEESSFHAHVFEFLALGHSDFHTNMHVEVFLHRLRADRDIGHFFRVDIFIGLPYYRKSRSLDLLVNFQSEDIYCMTLRSEVGVTRQDTRLLVLILRT